MKSKLAPHDEELWRQTLRDIPKFLAGKPSSFKKIEAPLPASQKEVKVARRALRATQQRFARIVGVSVETVKAWEAGRRKPEGTASKLIRLLPKNSVIAALFETA